MDEFFTYLDSLSPLSPELRAVLVGRLSKESFRKNRPLLSMGQVCDWIGFIEKGLVRVCYDIPNGDERIISFARVGDIVCAIKSFTAGVESRVSVVSMDDTVLRKLRRVEVESICEKHPSFNVHVRKMIERQTNLLEDHSMMLSLPMRHRLVVLKGSWILEDKRIKDYQVADYLGIDKGSLSRWRHGK